MGFQAKFEALIAGIDNSLAGEDEYGNLAWYIESSALDNAGDSSVELNFKCESEKYWEMAYKTADGCLDAWADYFPQLIK